MVNIADVEVLKEIMVKEFDNFSDRMLQVCSPFSDLTHPHNCNDARPESRCYSTDLQTRMRSKYE